MKKLISLLLCAGMMLSMASCDKQDLPQPQPAPEEPILVEDAVIELSDEKIAVTIDGNTTGISGVSGNQEVAVKDAQGNAAVTVAKNIIYYEENFYIDNDIGCNLFCNPRFFAKTEYP